MAFERPTLSDIVKRVQADAESRLGKKVMRWSLVSVLTRVIAGVSHGLHGYIAFVMQQCFTSTATSTYLERRASEYGIYRNAATKAEGTVTFEGDATVPSGTQLQNEQGTIYVTTADSKDGTAPIEALVAGADGNADEGMELTFVSPVAGVSSTATASALTGGADAEDDESLRERLLDRQRNPPKAGTKADYIAWAKEVSGVTRAWCAANEMGTGHVTVRFMTDGMTENGIPSETMIERVKEHIEESMPVTSILHVVAPIPVELDLTLEILPETDALKSQIVSAVESVLLTETEPGGEVLLTSLDRAISQISEITSYRIKSPTDDVTCSTGEIFVMGAITWQ